MVENVFYSIGVPNNLEILYLAFIAIKGFQVEFWKTYNQLQSTKYSDLEDVKDDNLQQIMGKAKDPVRKFTKKTYKIIYQNTTFESDLKSLGSFMKNDPTIPAERKEITFSVSDSVEEKKFKITDTNFEKFYATLTHLIKGEEIENHGFKSFYIIGDVIFPYIDSFSETETDELDKDEEESAIQDEDDEDVKESDFTKKRKEFRNRFLKCFSTIEWKHSNDSSSKPSLFPEKALLLSLVNVENLRKLLVKESGLLKGTIGSYVSY